MRLIAKITMALTACMMLSSAQGFAQRNGHRGNPGGQEHRPSVERPAGGRQENKQPAVQNNREPNKHNNQNNTVRPSGQRPGGQQPNGQRPGGAGGNVKPDNQRPNGNQPGGQPGNRPGGQPGGQPGVQPDNRPGGQPGNRPGGQPGGQPGVQPDNRPGGQPGNRPGGQPGGQPGVQPDNRPGGQPGNRPGGQPGGQPGPGHNPGPGGHPGPGVGHNPGPGHSVPPPGTRPHYNYQRPDYRPPRPNGGYWGAPKYVKHYWARPLPPMPPRPVYVRQGIPVIDAILGLTFGTFIDYGINYLYNSGYHVGGYINNTIYLTKVNQFGYSWPSVTIYYNDGLMSGADFQYYTSRNNTSRYNNMYAYFTNIFGLPIQEYAPDYYTRTATWWDGSNNTYITLQYGYNGSGYYTNVVIGR